MLAQLRPAFLILVWLTVITGVIYPLVVTVVAQVAFPYQAEGSVSVVDGRPLGSDLIGQHFDDPKYFWGRLSATGPVPYTAFNKDTLTGSSGSNLGPSNPALGDAAKARIDALRGENSNDTAPIPVDLVTASASGLDPHVSPAAAFYQVPRVAKARELDESALRELVTRHIEGRTIGILGEPRVNVLKLNLALDALAKK
jgi:K+-transporting ATPase ATPase C chain